VRILHVLPSFGLGGLGTLALSFVRALTEDSHAAIAPKYAGTSPELQGEFPCTTSEILRPVLDHVEYVRVLTNEIIKLGAFDSAIIYNFYDHVWSAIALKRAGIRNVLCHVGTVIAPEPATKMLTSPHTNEVTFVPASEAIRQKLKAYGAKNVGPTIWNGVDLSLFSKRTNGGSPIKVGFVGRMAPGAKDFPFLINGWGQMSAAVRKLAVLQLVGDGPLRGEYEKLADAFVEFLGQRSAEGVREFLAGLDIFVMAALPIEGMSIALVEAIATGLPIIATDVPSNREVLVGNGVLVETPARLAEALGKLILEPESRALYENRSRDYRNRFSIGACVAKYRELLA